MKKFTILFFLIIQSFYHANAQTITGDGIGGIQLLLYSDYKNEILTFQPALKITNTQNVIISGDFSSDKVVNIVPTAGYSIIIKPLVASSSPTARMMAEGKTVIKRSSNGTGHPGNKRFNLYPNPVDTVLNFDSPYGYVLSYQVFDLNENLKMEQNIVPTTSGTIDVSKLTTGTYVLNFILKYRTNTIQFIKN
jgi:Secretion system C-terminal sorting domain